ncbi:MAG: histidine kinase dimerization/phospho-acceptor domain-containing protein [Acidobacteriota bacterium]
MTGPWRLAPWLGGGLAVLAVAAHALALPHLALAVGLAASGLLVFATDQLGRRARAHRDAREALEAGEAQRRQLLADITHELATPLTSIRGYTETLQDPEVPTTENERDEYLLNILYVSRRM